MCIEFRYVTIVIISKTTHIIFDLTLIFPLGSVEITELKKREAERYLLVWPISRQVTAVRQCRAWRTMSTKTAAKVRNDINM